MNSLSWFIYFAGIVGSLNAFLLFLTGVAFLAFIAGLAIKFIVLIDDNDCEIERWKLFVKNMMCYGIIFCLIFGIIGNSLPDRKTMILIAASEVGERVVNSEKMAQVQNRVTQVLDPSLDLLTTWMKKETVNIQNELTDLQGKATGKDKK